MRNERTKRSVSGGKRLRNPRKPSIRDLLAAATGLWIEILSDAGIERALLDERGHPCPVCGEGRDRFTAFGDINDRGAVHCRICFTRGTAPCPGDGVATLRWRLGLSSSEACQWLTDWLASKSVPVSVSGTRTRSLGSRIKPDVADRIAKFELLAEQCRRCLHEAALHELGTELQMPIESLSRTGVGYSFPHHATTWPMRNENREVVGIRLRSITTGRKWAMTGSSAGVFIPDELPVKIEQLFVAEGPTDTAALLSLGVDAIGRPSANGATETICKTVKRLSPRECVVVADRDEVGQRTAKALCSQLLRWCGQVRMVTPPQGSKDVRDWVVAGAGLTELSNLVDAATPKRLALRRVRKI